MSNVSWSHMDFRRCLGSVICGCMSKKFTALHSLEWGFSFNMLLVISSVRAPEPLPIPRCSHLISSRCSDRLAVVASFYPFSGIRVFQLGAANFTMKYVLRHNSIYTFHEAISTLHVALHSVFFSVLVSKPFLLTDGLRLSTGS